MEPIKVGESSGLEEVRIELATAEDVDKLLRFVHKVMLVPLKL